MSVVTISERTKLGACHPLYSYQDKVHNLYEFNIKELKKAINNNRISFDKSQMKDQLYLTSLIEYLLMLYYHINFCKHKVKKEITSTIDLNSTIIVENKETVCWKNYISQKDINCIREYFNCKNIDVDCYLQALNLGLRNCG